MFPKVTFIYATTYKKSLSDARKRVILMIAIILISFVICWCPFHIEKLVEIVETSRTIDENIPQADLSDPQTMCRNETLKNLDQPSHSGQVVWSRGPIPSEPHGGQMRGSERRAGCIQGSRRRARSSACGQFEAAVSDLRTRRDQFQLSSATRFRPR